MLPRIFRRCRCFRLVLGPGVLQRVPLKTCPKHHDELYAYESVEHFIRDMA